MSPDRPSSGILTGPDTAIWHVPWKHAATFVPSAAVGGAGCGCVGRADVLVPVPAPDPDRGPGRAVVSVAPQPATTRIASNARATVRYTTTSHNQGAMDDLPDDVATRSGVARYGSAGTLRGSSGR